MKHPEQKSGEVFLGNTSLDNPSTERKYLRSLKTMRIGCQAFDINGKPLEPSERYAPLFLHESEEPEYERIMAVVLSNIRKGIPND